MALTLEQQREVSTYWAQINFVAVSIRADYSISDLNAAVAMIDVAFDTTLSAAVAAGHGAQTVAQALNSVIPAPFSGATAQQKTLLVSYVAMKRAGII